MSTIHPRLLLGGWNEAKSLSWLKQHKVTHILNCAREIPALYPSDFVYLNLLLDDVPEQDIAPALETSQLFVQWAYESSPSSVVFVHCMMGISRSSSMVINHLLHSKQHKTYEEAYRFVRSKRDIVHPNRGFVKQIKARYPSPGDKEVPFTT